jgi:hypothetical protein
MKQNGEGKVNKEVQLLYTKHCIHGKMVGFVPKCKNWHSDVATPAIPTLNTSESSRAESR